MWPGPPPSTIGGRSSCVTKVSRRRGSAISTRSIAGLTGRGSSRPAADRTIRAEHLSRWLSITFTVSASGWSPVGAAESSKDNDRRSSSSGAAVPAPLDRRRCAANPGCGCPVGSGRSIHPDRSGRSGYQSRSQDEKDEHHDRAPFRRPKTTERILTRRHSAGTCTKEWKCGPGRVMYRQEPACRPSAERHRLVRGCLLVNAVPMEMQPTARCRIIRKS